MSAHKPESPATPGLPLTAEAIPLLLQRAPDTLYIYDFTRQATVYCNRETFLGHNPAELGAPGPILTAVHPQDQTAVTAHWQRLQAGQLPPDAGLAYRVQAADGRWEWIQMRHALLDADAAGAPRRAAGFLTIITPFKAAEAALRQRELLYQDEQAQRELAEALRAGGEALSRTLDSADVLEQLLVQIARVVPYDSATVMLVEGNTARIISTRGYADRLPELSAAEMARWSFRLSETRNLRQVVETQQPLIIPDTHTDPNWIITPMGRHIRSWAGAPILVAGAVRAIFSLDKTEPDFFRPFHAQRLMAFAGQAGLALQNAQLYEAAQRQLQELSALSAVAVAGNAAIDEDDLLERFTTIVSQTLYPDNFGVLLLDPGGQYLYPHPSYQISAPYKHPERLAVGEGIVGEVAAGGKPRYVPDVTSVPNYLAIDARTRSELCAPIISDTRILGVINAESTRLNAFTADDENLLTTLASQLATALEKLRLLATERAQRRAAETLRAASMALTRNLELAHILDTLLDFMDQMAPYDSACLLCLDDHDTHLTVKHSRGAAATTYGDAGSLALEGDHIWRRLAETRQPHIIADLAADGAETIWPPMPGARSWLGLPMLTGASLLGFCGVARQTPNFFTAEHAAQAQALVTQAAVAIQNARLYVRIQNHAAELEQAVDERTQALRAANARLQELDRLKSKFVSDVSHELRTPAANLSLFLDLLERGQSDKREHYQAILRRQVDRLNYLIEDILSLARMESGMHAPHLRPVRLNAIVEQVLAAHAPHAAGAATDLRADLAADLAPVLGDPKQLVQVLTNLLVNALNYAPGGQVTLRTGWDATRGKVCLEVTDTGMGIPAEELPHIFERFYRGRRVSQSNISGTGLGLAIVQEIVSAHNGELEVHSREGAGTRVRVWLPAAAES